jgi:hypothetical protein
MVAMREKVLNQPQRVAAAVAITMTIPFRPAGLHTAGLILMAAVLVPALWNWERRDSAADLGDSEIPAVQ